MKRVLLWFPLILLILAVPKLSAADEFLRWPADAKGVDADLRTWSLPKVLGAIAQATGWQVYVEPGVDQQISVKFKNLPPGDALKRLLGSLSYKMTPETNGVTLIHVFQTSPRNATQFVLAPESPTKRSKNLIPNELIVTLKPGGDIDKLARELGAKVVGKIDGLNTYRLQFADEAAAGAGRQALTDNSQVAQIDSNYSMERPVVADAFGPTGNATINLKPVAKGAGNQLIVGLIDMPVQPLGYGMDEFILKAISAAGPSNPDPNSPTHYPAMAETILRGVSSMSEQNTSNVRILPVDVYGNNTSTTDPNNHISTKTWDNRGRLASETGADRQKRPCVVRPRREPEVTGTRPQAQPMPGKGEQQRKILPAGDAKKRAGRDARAQREDEHAEQRGSARLEPMRPDVHFPVFPVRHESLTTAEKPAATGTIEVEPFPHVGSFPNRKIAEIRQAGEHERQPDAGKE